MPYFKIILIFAILVVASLLPIPKWNEQPQPPTPKQEEQPQPDCSMKIILSMVDESVLYCDRRRANCRKENIRAVLTDQGSQDPFNVFARDAETAVIDATQKAFCTHDTATLPVVELHFIKLGLIGNESRKAQFYSLMSPIKGSYADIQIDNERNRIAATIIWNPVVMLRDQMSVERHDLGKKNPYIQAYFGGHPSPIDEKKLEYYTNVFIETVILAKTQEEKDAARTKFRKGAPPFIYTLIEKSEGRIQDPTLGSPRVWSHDISPEAMIRQTAEELISASRSGYSAMARAAIKRRLEDDTTTPLKSIDEIDRPDIRELYRAGKWGAPSR